MDYRFQGMAVCEYYRELVTMKEVRRCFKAASIPVHMDAILTRISNIRRGIY
jgi:hypothetical protein